MFEKLFSWLSPENDGIADLRSGLGRLVTRAMEEGATIDEAWSIDLTGCKIRGKNVGDWVVVVYPTKEPPK